MRARAAFPTAAEDGGGRGLGAAGPGAVCERGGRDRRLRGEAAGRAAQEEGHSGLQRRGHGAAAGAVGGAGGAGAGGSARSTRRERRGCRGRRGRAGAALPGPGMRGIPGSGREASPSAVFLPPRLWVRVGGFQSRGEGPQPALPCPLALARLPGAPAPSSVPASSLVCLKSLSFSKY